MADATCSADGCSKRVRAKGLCVTHYNRQLEPKGKCAVEGCEEPHHAKGWCKRHHRSWIRHGDVLAASRRDGILPCGTNAAYNRGCRCEDCSAAALAYQQEWRRNNKERWSELRKRGNRKWRAAKRDAVSEPYSTSEILDRDGWRCGLCGKRIGKTLKFPHPRSASIDHIVPLSVGGDDTRANVQAAHLTCNVSKGNRAQNDQLRFAV